MLQESLAGEIPIKHANARVDALHPKHFDIVFPALPSEACMVDALCDEGALQLVAPNRVSRESLLLALGIANFNGKPSDLTTSSLLFPDARSLPCAPISEKEKEDDSLDETGLLNSGPLTAEEGCSSCDDMGSTTTGGASDCVLSSSALTLCAAEPDAKGQLKMQALESEIVKLNNLLTAKNDFSLSLHAQVKQLEAELRQKNLEVDFLQQDLRSSKEKNLESCEALVLAQKQIE